MIDTVKFHVPLNDSNLVQKLRGNLMRFRKEDLRTGKVEFEFHSSTVELGSHHRTVSIKATEIPLGFFIELSVAKYEKGNNVEMIYPRDLPVVMEKLHKELCDYMSYPFPPYSEWTIYRLDLCYNWLLKDYDEALCAIDFIKRIDYPRKQKFVWDTSVMYKGTAYTIKFYLKGPEFKVHDAKVLDSETKRVLQPLADKIFRFEISLKRTYLQEFLNRSKVYLKDIIDDAVISEILQYFLEYKVLAYLSAKSITNSEVKKILLDKFTKQKATKLYQFYRSYYSNEDDARDMIVRGGLNRSTIYRYKVDLKKLNIGLPSDNETIGKGIMEKLIIPSPDTRFDLLDQK